MAIRRMGVVLSPAGLPRPGLDVTVRNWANGDVMATAVTNDAGKWDVTLSDETKQYWVEVAAGGTSEQMTVQTPASIELEYLFVRYGLTALSGPVALPTNTTIGGASINQAALDSRYVNAAGDVMSGNLSLLATGAAMELGNPSVAGTPLIDFNSSGHANDFDSRIFASGGAVGNGLGAISLIASTVGVNAALAVVGATALQGVLTLPNGTLAAPALAFGTDPNTGLYRYAEGTLALSTNGVARLIATPTGVTVTGDLGATGEINGTDITGDSMNTTILNTVSLLVNGNVGFYGGPTVAKPTVTGAKAGNAALTSLCAALATLGLITNSTS